MATTNERSEVTAQDFIDCIVVDFTASPTLATEETKQAFDALLSRARQEAVEEYKASKELKHTVIDEVVKQELIKTRSDALKEMDEAHLGLDEAKSRKDNYAFGAIMNIYEKLRQEYQ